MSRFYDLVVGVGRGVYRSMIRTQSLPDKEVFFPEAAMLERNFPAIRAEVLRLPGGLSNMPKVHEALEEQSELFEHDSIPWGFAPLYAFGRGHPQNLARMPAVAELLPRIPGLLSATISVLDPGKHIPPHCGPYAGMLRYHLALIVPPPSAGRPPSYFRVDGHVIEWKEGEGFLFDDSFEHEAVNNSNQPRVVLIVDILNPTMPIGLRLVDRMLRAFVNRLPFADRYMSAGALPDA